MDYRKQPVFLFAEELCQLGQAGRLLPNPFKLLGLLVNVLKLILARPALHHLVVMVSYLLRVKDAQFSQQLVIPLSFVGPYFLAPQQVAL